MVDLAIEVEDILRVAAVGDAFRRRDRAAYMERTGLGWHACHDCHTDKKQASEEVCHRAPRSVGDAFASKSG
jgi:hypothetical protein